MKLNIHLEEADKVKKGKEFYTIKQILRRNFDESMLNDKILIRKDYTMKFEILSYCIFDNIQSVFKCYNFKVFNVGNSEEEVLEYYKKLNGKHCNRKWITVVFKLKEL